MHINAYTVYTSHTHTHTHTHTNTKQVYNVTVKAATHGLNNNTHTYIHHTGPHTHNTCTKIASYSYRLQAVVPLPPSMLYSQSTPTLSSTQNRMKYAFKPCSPIHLKMQICQ